MSRHAYIFGVVVIEALALLAGCRPQQPFYFHESGDMSHYRGLATEIEVPDTKVQSYPDVENDNAPLTLSNPDPKEIWDLTLQDAMQIALSNAKVMKQLGAAVTAVAGSTGPGVPAFLLQNPSVVPSIYDPSLSETDPRAGVEAALSAFDTQFSVTSNWGRTDEPVNSTLGTLSASSTSGAFPSALESGLPNMINGLPVNIGDTASFQAQLRKTDATGGTVAVTHGINYISSNSGQLFFPSSYVATVDAEIRQPLLRGSGVEFNRIAGPGAQPGVFGGVVIARINTDIALAGFEAGVRNLVSDVENAYWELYFTYRNLDAVLAGRNSALTTWRRIYALYQLGAKGGEADREAQAREQYFLFRSSVERGLVSLYNAEANLRYMMGIASTDGRLIRTADEPTTAKVEFDWCAIHNEALVRSVELREQRWVIKRREMELIASKNYLMPQLDAVARYRWLGLGDQLTSPSSSGVNGEFSSAEGNLLTGHYQEWTAGFEFQMPLGFRRELSGVRNAELHLTRERAVLREAELELSHQLARAIRELDAQLMLTETNFNRRVAADRQVKAVEAAYNTGTVTIDVLLNAQRLLAQAESDYYRSEVDYNRAIAGVHFRKGSLLEYNGVFLAEGPWPGKAYFDACRQARARDAAHYIDYGVTRPQVISRGAYAQEMGTTGANTAAAGGAPTIAPPPGTEGTPVPAAPQPPVPPATERQQTPAPKASGTQASGPTLVPPQAENTQKPADPTVMRQPQPSARKGYALENLNLNGLANAAPGQRSPMQQTSVQQTSYQQTVDSPSSAGSGAGWTAAARAGTSYEPVANPSSAQLDRSAAGWRRAND